MTKFMRQTKISILLFFLTLGFLTLIFTGQAYAADKNVPIPFEKVKLVNDRTNKELHMNSSDNAVVYNNAGNSNEWYFIPSNKDGYYYIKNIRTGLELHMNKNDDVVGYDGCDNSNRWRLKHNTDNTVEIVNERTGLSLHNTSDDRVVGYDYCGDSNEWKIVHLNSVQPVKLVNTRTDRELHMNRYDDAVVYNNAGNSNRWYFIPSEIEGYYYIKNERTGLQLHMKSNNNVVGFTNDGNNSNRWMIKYNGDYKVEIVNERTGLSLHNTSDDRVVGYQYCGNSNEWTIEDTVKPSKDNDEELDKGQQIVNYAKQFLGTPYEWEGSTPSGFDCSGLTMYVYNHFGVSLPHNAKMQYNDRKGSYVSKSNLLPGDLVFFNTNENLGHVGIYIGNGQFIHAPNSNSKVKIESLNSDYYRKRYAGAKRFFNYAN